MRGNLKDQMSEHENEEEKWINDLKLGALI